MFLVWVCPKGIKLSQRITKSSSPLRIVLFLEEIVLPISLSKNGVRSLWLMMVLAMRVRESNSSSIGQESLQIRELVWSSFDIKKIFS
jgi:hypothetical protein